MLPGVRVLVGLALVWAIAEAVYDPPEDREPYTIAALAPDPNSPTEAEESFDGFAACNGYVPDLPTDECDGPAVPSNNVTDPPVTGDDGATPPPAPAAPVVPADDADPEPEEDPDDGQPIPFASTETDTSETLAPPVVVENDDGTTTIELFGVLAAEEDADGDGLSDDSGEPVTAVTFTGIAESGEWNPGVSTGFRGGQAAWLLVV